MRTATDPDIKATE